VRVDPAAAAEQVRLRRHAASKDFKGSCFVEMGDAAAMTALVAKSAAGEIVHDGAPLKLEPKVRAPLLFHLRGSRASRPPFQPLTRQRR
jgi:hypothetical protein